MPKLKTMMNLSSLLGLAGLGGDILKARIARRMMKDVAGVIALAVATGFMAGALLVGLGYLAYQALIRGGLEPNAALVVILLIVASGIYALLRKLQRKLLLLKRARVQNFPGGAAFNARIYALVDSFLDGFAGPR